jgi:hypothetical protein
LGIFVCFFLAAGCGEGHAPNAQLATTRSEVLAEVEITGNLATEANRTAASLLVFFYPADADPPKGDPLGVGLVDANGAFVLTVQPESAVVVFLDDQANDGVIDLGDSFAVLEDPTQQLSDLQAGDRVAITDVEIDLTQQKAKAAKIERISAQAPPTPTSAPSR